MKPLWIYFRMTLDMIAWLKIWLIILRHLQIWNETVWEVLTFRVVLSIHELPTE